MMEYAAFGFVALKWWTWPLVFVVVMAAVWGAVRLSTWQDHRKYEAFGPHPCLKHLGTEPDGREWWCWLREGHAGPHHNEWMVSEDDIREAPSVPPVSISEVATETNPCLVLSGCALGENHRGLCSPFPRP